jgi:hypothetical protein
VGRHSGTATAQKPIIAIRRACFGSASFGEALRWRAHRPRNTQIAAQAGVVDQGMIQLTRTDSLPRAPNRKAATDALTEKPQACAKATKPARLASRQARSTSRKGCSGIK